MSTVWGGAQMLCIPAADGKALPVFQRLVRAYDPDLVLPWLFTLGSLGAAHPEEANAWLERTRGSSPNNSFLAAMGPDWSSRSREQILYYGTAEEAFDGLIANSACW